MGNGTDATRHNRDNNFNLIRMAAAFAVLVSHSFALTQGIDAQPAIHGIRLGAFAVDVFFVTSGYLVTASVMRRPVVEFVAARMLRIYPALIVAVSLTVLVAYLHTGDVAFDYWVRNALLVPGAPGTIAGVFEHNPSAGVNGSLWTLPYEVRMYAALLVLWLATRRWFLYTTPALAALCLAAELVLRWPLTHLAWMFFAGASLYVLNARVSFPIAATLLALATLALIDAFSFRLAYLLYLPYIVIVAAHVPGLTAYNRLGDYSYGLYIYAFPVQQVWVAAGVTNPLAVLALATITTLPLAVLSWHLVERRALGLKDRVSHQLFARYPMRP